MKDIAIYGSEGFGKEVACLLDLINKENPQWNLVGFFDDTKPKGVKISHFGETLGGAQELNAYPKRIAIVIAAGHQNAVKTIYGKITNDNVEFPNIISPLVRFADKETFKIGKGNIIQSNCFFSCNVKIGNFNVFNGSNTFGHDDVVGDFNAFMPASRVSGNVFIGYNNFFGVGSIIIEKLKIGHDVRIGAGGILMTKPKDGMLYIGNPAKIVKF